MNFITIQRCIALTCKSNINVIVYKTFSTKIPFNKILTKRVLTTKPNVQLNYNNLLHTSITQFDTEKVLNNLTQLKNNKSSSSPVQLKKRPKKRKSLSDDKGNVEAWKVKALSTSEEYNLEALVQGLIQQQLYVPSTITTLTSWEGGEIKEESPTMCFRFWWFCGFGLEQS